MDTYDFALRGGLESEGIIVPEVLLGGEGEFYDILYCADIIGADVHLLELLPVEWYIMIDIIHHLVQALPLHRAHLVARHRFFVFVPNHRL